VLGDSFRLETGYAVRVNEDRLRKRPSVNNHVSVKAIYHSEGRKDRVDDLQANSLKRVKWFEGP
jgi:hypothetical protein